MIVTFDSYPRLVISQGQPGTLSFTIHPLVVLFSCVKLFQLSSVTILAVSSLFLGNKKFKDSCMHLRWSLTNLNRSQGLGFLVFSVRACPLHLPVVVVCAIAAFTKTSSGPQ